MQSSMNICFFSIPVGLLLLLLQPPVLGIAKQFSEPYTLLKGSTKPARFYFIFVQASISCDLVCSLSFFISYVDFFFTFCSKASCFSLNWRRNARISTEKLVLWKVYSGCKIKRRLTGTKFISPPECLIQPEGICMTFLLMQLRYFTNYSYFSASRSPALAMSFDNLSLLQVHLFDRHKVL